MELRIQFFVSDVHVLDCETWEWSRMNCSGNYPEMRFGHTCVIFETTAIIFGGSRGAGYFNDLHCLDVQSWGWWQPKTSGVPPTPRSSHRYWLSFSKITVSHLGLIIRVDFSAVRLNKKIFIFGGIGSTAHTQNECLKDIVVLDLDSWSWSAPQVKGAEPQPRFVHRMVEIRSKLLLFGGRTSGREKFNDVHLFDPENLTWTKGESIAGEPPSSRGGCSLVAVGDSVSLL